MRNAPNTKESKVEYIKRSIDECLRSISNIYEQALLEQLNKYSPESLKIIGITEEMLQGEDTIHIIRQLYIVYFSLYSQFEGIKENMIDTGRFKAKDIFDNPVLKPLNGLCKVWTELEKEIPKLKEFFILVSLNEEIMKDINPSNWCTYKDRISDAVRPFAKDELDRSPK